MKEGRLALQKMRGEFLANKFWKESLFFFRGLMIVKDIVNF